MKYNCEILTMSDSHQVAWHSWIPETEVKAVVLLSHGMLEYALRYDDFAKFLCENGIAFYGEDHRGHGKTGKLSEENGTGMMAYLNDKDGFFRVVDDIHEEALILKERYPNKKVFLLGHSFGSFVTQCFIEKYGSCINGVLICGSAGPRLFTVNLAKGIASIIRFFIGKKKPSKFINSLAFGSYNSKIENKKTDSDWLTRDENIVNKYLNDELCGGIPTVQFFFDLFSGLSYIHKKTNMKKIPKNLPTFIIAGDADPVGSYGKTVENLYNIYKSLEIKDLELKLYKDARHELFNEINKQEVYLDVLNWLSNRI